MIRDAWRVLARPGRPRAPARAATLGLALLAGACASPEGARVDLALADGTTLVVTRGVARVDGGTLVWESAGDGLPVVLLHGEHLDRRVWDDQLAPLAADHRVVRYDLRGHGHSSPPAGPFTHHDDLLALLDQLDLPRVHLVGQSLGGRVAVDFELQHTQRVASLALAAPELSGWRESALDPQDPLARGLAARDEARITGAWLVGPGFAPALEEPAVAARLRELAHDNASSWLVPDTERPLHPPANERLADLQAPLLLLLGARDEPDAHAVVERLANAVPGARVATFDGAGHLVNMERPEAFTRELVQWLAEAEARQP